MIKLTPKLRHWVKNALLDENLNSLSVIYNRAIAWGAFKDAKIIDRCYVRLYSKLLSLNTIS